MPEIPGNDLAHLFWVILMLVLLYKLVVRITARQHKATRPTGWLYFIGNGRGPIKVGFTTETPEGRLSALQTGNPSPLRVLYAIPVADPQDAEGRIHNILEGSHVGGEWYKREAVMYLIMGLKQARGEIDYADASLRVIEGGK
jgi:hypothetical protein